MNGSPFDYDEKLASKMYEIVGNYYGTAGKEFINVILEKYSKNDYEILRRELKIAQEKLEKKSSNDIRSYITAVALVVLADMIVEEDIMGGRADETSIEMGLEILDNLAKQQDIDIVDKCYEYIKSWILANHKSFDEYAVRGYYENSKLNPEDDLISKGSNSRSMGLFHSNVYYVHRSVLEDKLKSSGYSYNKIIREFAKRGYITPKTDDKGNILENTVQKKYRGRNARMFAFPIEPIENLEEEERKIAEEELINMAYITNKITEIGGKLDLDEDIKDQKIEKTKEEKELDELIEKALKDKTSE